MIEKQKFVRFVLVRKFSEFGLDSNLAEYYADKWLKEVWYDILINHNLEFTTKDVEISLGKVFVKIFDKNTTKRSKHKVRIYEVNVPIDRNWQSLTEDYCKSDYIHSWHSYEDFFASFNDAEVSDENYVLAFADEDTEPEPIKVGEEEPQPKKETIFDLWSEERIARVQSYVDIINNSTKDINYLHLCISNPDYPNIENITDAIKFGDQYFDEYGDLDFIINFDVDLDFFDLELQNKTYAFVEQLYDWNDNPDVGHYVVNFASEEGVKEFLDRNIVEKVNAFIKGETTNSFTQKDIDIFNATLADCKYFTAKFSNLSMDYNEDRYTTDMDADRCNKDGVAICIKILPEHLENIDDIYNLSQFGVPILEHCLNHNGVQGFGPFQEMYTQDNEYRKKWFLEIDNDNKGLTPNDIRGIAGDILFADQQYANLIETLGKATEKLYSYSH